MHTGNNWGGSFDTIDRDPAAEEERRRNLEQWDRAALHSRQLSSQRELDETQQGWLLASQDSLRNNRKKKYVNLGCVTVSHKAVKWTLGAVAVAFLIIALPIIIVKTLPGDKPRASAPDNYTLALNKALLFFNAQKSGKLPKKNGVPWRGDSGLNDGKGVPELPRGLIGGYYDAGDNIKFHFPMAYSMTMLSWSVIEYSHKFKAIDEYDHIRELIKWGTDYLLLTFNSTATTIDKIYIQVGGALNGSTVPDDHYCWQRPEDMNYKRPVLDSGTATDLAGEMTAALAAASIVFRDKPSYSKKLARGAETLWRFARRRGNRGPHSRGNPMIEPFYNSTSIYDEYMWGGAWLYYATGNTSYIQVTTDPRLPRTAEAFRGKPNLYVPTWNNKLPSAMLLMTRYRIFLSPGYPYEDMLKMYHNTTGLVMCSYLQQYRVFNWTKGGLIQLNEGKPQPLQYAAHASFLASLFADYLNAINVPGWYCGSNFVTTDVLKDFATSQIDYILGKNPLKMSYVVGFGKKFPRHVHHRGASMPNDGKRRSCTQGWKWRDTSKPNPHNITGAMVAGPDHFDRFRDVRTNYNYTEPTLVGNAGLVAALVSLTSSGGYGVDKNTMFAAVPPLYTPSSPPPPVWKP